MTKKRADSARTLAEPNARGRPRRSTRGTYASAPKNQDIEDPLIEEQLVAGEEHLAPDPTQ
jgi:hypothetical protein